MIASGDFARAVPGHWHLETDEQTKAGWTLEAGGPDGRRELKVVVTQGRPRRLASAAHRGRFRAEEGFALHADLLRAFGDRPSG